MVFGYIFFIAWGAYRLIKYIDHLSDLNDPVKYRKMHHVEYNVQSNHVKFLVNHREVDEQLFEYYSKLLGLYKTGPLNDRTILAAYRQMRKSLLTTNDEYPVAEIDDIDAARRYLTDQWAYMSSYN